MDTCLPYASRPSFIDTLTYFWGFGVLGFWGFGVLGRLKPLAGEAEVRLRYVNSVEALGRPDLVVLPGSKTTISDLDWLQSSGLAQRIMELYRQGVFVIGICGGYQMLGVDIDDPDHIESPLSHRQGLGLLPVSTVFHPPKHSPGERRGHFWFRSAQPCERHAFRRLRDSHGQDRLRRRKGIPNIGALRATLHML